MAMGERTDKQDHLTGLVCPIEPEHPTGRERLTGPEHPIEQEHPTEPEHLIEQEHLIERALRTEVLCRTGNRHQHLTGHQASILRPQGLVHRMEVEAVQWEEEVVLWAAAAEEGDKG